MNDNFELKHFYEEYFIKIYNHLKQSNTKNLQVGETFFILNEDSKNN